VTFASVSDQSYHLHFSNSTQFNFWFSYLTSITCL